MAGSYGSFHLKSPVQKNLFSLPCTVADPGFTVGGRSPCRGGANTQGSYVSNILYVNAKESGSLEAPLAPHPLDPPMVYNKFSKYTCLKKLPVVTP